MSKKIFLSALAIFSLLAVSTVNADTYTDKIQSMNLLNGTRVAAGYAYQSPYGLSGYVGNIIYVFLGLLGTVFLVLTVYAGYVYMTAGGDEEDTKKSLRYLRNAIIGLIIVLAAFGITRFVIYSLSNIGAVT